MIRRIALILPLLFVVSTASAAPIDNKDGFWNEWSDAIFAKAAAEKKFVIVSLQSWWCRWCHGMNHETWANAEVRGVLKDKFIPVYVDQDSRPDISQRYERWGWPATIIFAPDGTEIVKLRGFYSPQFFIPILAATIDDPSPVNYPDPGGEERGRSLATGLTEAQRNEILDFIDKAWDEEHGGWSKSKFVDGNMLIWVLQRARQGDAVNTARIKRVLTMMARTMIDITGALDQVNLSPDWTAPAHEYPMFAQEAGLAAYSRAWTMFGDPAFRQAADRIYGFLRNNMRALAGGFYASYGMSEGTPGFDRRVYARETAQAASGLLAYYDATGIVEARDLAARAMKWAVNNRAMPDGGFRHAVQDNGGPYLADNVEMAKALLALHRSTGEREWLSRAQATADFIAKTFVDPATGGFIASASPDAKQMTKPIKQREDNVTAVRMFALLSAYTGEAKYREIAEAGMGYLTSPPILEAFSFLPDVLLAEDELRNEPVHVTIVGAKDDARSAALYRAALAYPLVNKRAEWWDRREGRLANPDVDYPDFPDGPAAFACTSTFCSYPVTQASEIAGQLDNLKRARKF